MPAPDAWLDIAWTRPPGLAAHPVARPILDLLAETIVDPEAIAMVGAGERVSYAQLVRQARLVAAHVRAEVPEGKTVAVLIASSPSGFAGILGCMAAGRVCIVMDPTHPHARNAAILRDARPHAILLHDGAIATAFGDDAPPLILHLAAALAGDAPPAAWDLDPDAPALVHYTSGSTGVPKGVATSARAVLRRALLERDSLRIDGRDCFLGTSLPVSNSGFCSSLGALFGGARVLICTLQVEGIGALFDMSRREGLTLLYTGPSIMRMLMAQAGAKAALARLRLFRSGGEAILRGDLAAWRAGLPAGCDVVHSYGSTEAMGIAYWRVPECYADPDPRLPAGFPLPDQDYALLDPSGCNAAPGEAGELALRSRYVASGEWQDGRLVAGRIRADPTLPGHRIVRTGDLVRLDEGGMLRMSSRADRQIKVNGWRVEPAEVESLLRGTPGVVDAVLVAQAAPDGQMLRAYVAAPVARHAELHDALTRRVQAELLSPMRPRQIVMLDQLPYLPVGKVDFGALAVPAPVPPPPRPPPANAAKALLELVAATLKLPVEAIGEASGIRDTLGWDSLHHIMLMMRVEQAYGIELSDDDMSTATTVQDIRRVLHARGVA